MSMRSHECCTKRGLAEGSGTPPGAGGSQGPSRRYHAPCETSPPAPGAQSRPRTSPGTARAESPRIPRGGLVVESVSAGPAAGTVLFAYSPAFLAPRDDAGRVREDALRARPGRGTPPRRERAGRHGHRNPSAQQDEAREPRRARAAPCGPSEGAAHDVHVNKEPRHPGARGEQGRRARPAGSAQGSWRPTWASTEQRGTAVQPGGGLPPLPGAGGRREARTSCAAQTTPGGSARRTA